MPADHATGAPDIADGAFTPTVDAGPDTDAQPPIWDTAHDTAASPGPDSGADEDAPILDSDAPLVADAPDVPPDAGALPPVVLPSLGGARPAKVVAPGGYSTAGALPLVVLLHGYSVTGVVQDLYLGLSGRVGADGFILVIPEGTIDSKGNPFWNATDYCCDFDGVGVDDVGYLSSLLDEAEATLPVDPKRIYLFGHSNGGFMAYRLACEAGDRIAAIVALAGTSFADPAKCVDPGRVSVLHVHGTADGTIPYGGTPDFPGAEEVVARWVTRDACDPAPSQGEPLDLDLSVDGAETNVDRWTGCADGTAVELWTLEGGGHIPAFSNVFSEMALAFLLSRSQP